MVNFNAIYPDLTIDILLTNLVNKGFRYFSISLGSEYKAMVNDEQLKGLDTCFKYDHESDDIFEYAVSPKFSKYYLNNEHK